MRTPAAYISLKIWQIAFSIARNYIKIGVTALIDSSLHIVPRSCTIDGEIRSN